MSPKGSRSLKAEILVRPAVFGKRASGKCCSALRRSAVQRYDRLVVALHFAEDNIGPFKCLQHPLPGEMECRPTPTFICNDT